MSTFFGYLLFLVVFSFYGLLKNHRLFPRTGGQFIRLIIFFFFLFYFIYREIIGQSVNIVPASFETIAWRIPLIPWDLKQILVAAAPWLAYFLEGVLCGMLVWGEFKPFRYR